MKLIIAITKLDEGREALLTGLRVSPEVELERLDIGEHGERAYNY